MPRAPPAPPPCSFAHAHSATYLQDGRHGARRFRHGNGGAPAAPGRYPERGGAPRGTAAARAARGAAIAEPAPGASGFMWGGEGSGALIGWREGGGGARQRAVIGTRLSALIGRGRGGRGGGERGRDFFLKGPRSNRECMGVHVCMGVHADRWGCVCMAVHVCICTCVVCIYVQMCMCRLVCVCVYVHV